MNQVKDSPFMIQYVIISNMKEGQFFVYLLYLMCKFRKLSVLFIDKCIYCIFFRRLV